MRKSKLAIISPSGKFYGSEQTLYSYLKETPYSFDVFVNKNDGRLIEKLITEKKHYVLPFKRVKALFIKLFLFLLMGKYKRLYFNEGGYIRYVKILARIFPRKKFFIHIRLTEDTTGSRTRNIPGNIRLISVSKYIQEEVVKNCSQQTMILSSPYRGNQNGILQVQALKTPVRNITVVGRVTTSKGIENARLFIEFLSNHINEELIFNFYGDVEENRPDVKEFMQRCGGLSNIQVIFHGYTTDKTAIYNNTDVVIHFNEFEPLGVIFFEALTFGIPFIGLNSGGIGEIAKNLGIADLMVNKKTYWQQELYTIMNSISDNRDRYIQAQHKMVELYSVRNYTRKLEEIILNEAC